MIDVSAYSRPRDYAHDLAKRKKKITTTFRVAPDTSQRLLNHINQYLIVIIYRHTVVTGDCQPKNDIQKVTDELLVWITILVGGSGTSWPYQDNWAFRWTRILFVWPVSHDLVWHKLHLSGTNQWAGEAGHWSGADWALERSTRPRAPPKWRFRRELWGDRKRAVGLSPCVT